ncbi:alginate export family protein [Mucilaginibacter sp.]|uniref:alginate export family protein n=1 Tax=Mucilaginibacter sp. TaxID=1882438 RepID=UPI002629627A|nr:alginate export family protein [Mucilaginibacter sp.]MDB4922946.1 hypothetical protein [Mucilaginibacter sp.]
MKAFFNYRIILLPAFVMLCVAVSAQNFKPLRYDEDYSYLRNDTSRNWYDNMKFQPLSKNKETYLSYGGEVRYQYFWFQNENWGAAPKDKDGFFLTRYLGSVDFHAGSHFRTFVQLQSSLANGQITSPNPVDQNLLDLHQAFFDVSFIENKNKDLIFRFGRQEMAYGSQRLVSVREAPNNRQAFDAAKFIYKGKDFRIDAFYGDYVPAKSGIFDDGVNKNTSIWGSYAAFNDVPFFKDVDFYYLGIHRKNTAFDDGKGKETRHSIGSRIWNTAPDWSYDFEGLYQFGKFNSDNISAWTLSSNTSYTFFHTPLKPEFGLKTELISGDRHYGDGKLNTFDPLFPKGAYFGLASLIGPSNLEDVHPYFSLAFTKRLSFTADYDFFWRMSTNDGIYAVNTSLIYSGKNSNSKKIGNQLQAMLEYSVNKFLYLRGDFTWFQAGQYLKDVGPGKDILMSSGTVQFKF